MPRTSKGQVAYLPTESGSTPVIDPSASKKDEQTLLKEDLDRMMDQAYRSTIVTFCDSVFPSPTPSTGKAWTNASTEFHNQTVQIGERLIKKYPNIPETTIRQDCETRFQSLVTSVFTQMRNNGQTIIIAKWKKWSRCFFHFSFLFPTFAKKKMMAKMKYEPLLFLIGNDAGVL